MTRTDREVVQCRMWSEKTIWTVSSLQRLPNVYINFSGTVYFPAFLSTSRILRVDVFFARCFNEVGKREKEERKLKIENTRLRWWGKENINVLSYMRIYFDCQVFKICLCFKFENNRVVIYIVRCYPGSLLLFPCGYMQATHRRSKSVVEPRFHRKYATFDLEPSKARTQTIIESYCSNWHVDHL
jgi:hypothetical protein